ncbi:hypothetical protein OG241_06610 [Streptomyces sp. NBC_01390]|uniref:hypothetical protein n=1 Tax=Streptomyces sp. NBC_01390 TaxID=2903850 RepID=UPI003255E70E
MSTAAIQPLSFAFGLNASARARAGGIGQTVPMGALIQQLETAAHILGSAGNLVQVHVVCELGEQPFVRLHTPHQLTVADQRSAVDRVAAVLGEVPLLQPVFTGRHGTSVRGVRDGVEIVAVTNAAIPDGCSSFRGTG